MRLDPAILEELAAFYTRRLPDDAGAIAQRCGMPRPDGTGENAWRALLLAAESQGRVHTIASAVARALPADENAQRAAQDLAPNRPWAVAAAVAACVVVLLAVGIAASSGTAQAENAPSPAPQARVEVPEATAVAAPVAAQPATAPVVESAATAPPAPAAIEAPAPQRPHAVASLAPSTKVPRFGCHADPGSTVGWWYAGQSAPGQAGQTITLTRGANVRAGAPSAESHWRLAPPVGCGLEAGDRITLGEVREIPGGVWVELKG